MSALDWIVLFTSLALIVIIGVIKTRKNNSLSSYLRGNDSESWATIGLSIMATQASAITFLSTPGQAYASGMGFVQFYFGLPLAMIIISIFFLPLFYKLKVYTAYQYLEDRFDHKVRAFTAFLFLVSRGLAAGITIYAPSIILSVLLGWNLQLTCIAIGGLVIIYTVSGGSRAVSLTQKWQMGVILAGMFLAFYFVIEAFPLDIGFSKGMAIAGNMGKMNIIDLSPDLSNRYTLLSGLTGGLFLFLSYFGTDQSQVQRYLGGKSLKASRIGLMFNGLMKIPMQFFILLIGAMVFVAYQFHQPPIIFNKTATQAEILENPELVALENQYEVLFEEKKIALSETSIEYAYVNQLQLQQDSIRNTYQEKLTTFDKNYPKKDTDYIFLTFVLNFLPHGLIGLLLAVIFSAAMSSTAGELNALASTTTIDFYKKYFRKEDSPQQDVRAGKILTIIWGLLAIGIALIAGLFENLIQLVNLLGSLFYGTILGIFLLAFFLKFVKSRAALIGAIIGQIAVLALHLANVYEIVNLGYLMYNIIGSAVVVLSALLFQTIVPSQKSKTI